MPLHDRALLVGQHLRLDLVDAELARDGLRRGPVVAGEHHHADALLLERGERLGRRWLDRIGDGKDGRNLPVHPHEDRGCAVLAQPVGLIGQRRDIDALLGEELGIAKGNALALDHSERALAGG